MQILYVEDDDNSRSVMQMIQRMNREQFDLVVFEDSTDFQNRLLGMDQQPDLILLDIHMEPYTGFEMLEMIRQHSQYDDIPVVALTASVMNEEVDVLQAAGFQSILSKPLDMDSFPSIIDRIMQGERISYIW